MNWIAMFAGDHKIQYTGFGSPRLGGNLDCLRSAFGLKADDDYRHSDHSSAVCSFALFHSHEMNQGVPLHATADYMNACQKHCLPQNDNSCDTGLLASHVCGAIAFPCAGVLLSLHKIAVLAADLMS